MDLAGMLETVRVMPPWFGATIVAMFSGLLGSFINVCIYRIPRRQSIVTPRSRCPACGHVLGVPDLVPVLSWLVLRGSCRHCGAPVAVRYTLVELAIMIIWVGSFLVFGVDPLFLVVAGSLSLVFTLAGIVLHGRTLPPPEPRNGLTFLEILFTAVILAAVVSPFLNLNWQGRSGAVRNRERIIAYGLAREKLEELRTLPTRKLVSDFELYRGRSSGASENIFRDEFFGTWAKMDEDEDLFWANWSDIVTETGETGTGQVPETVFPKFKERWHEYYGFEWEPYPKSYTAYRRFTTVDDLTDPANPGNLLKRVTVVVEITSKVHTKYKVTLASYFSDN